MKKPESSIQQRKMIITFTMLCIAALMMFSPGVFAAESTGGALPYESWLKTLQQSLTGPVAFSVALIGIVTCGITLILSGGQINRFMQSIIFLVLVMTMLIGANSLMTRFFNGASIGEVTVPLLAVEKSAAPQLIEDQGLDEGDVPLAMNRQDLTADFKEEIF